MKVCSETINKLRWFSKVFLGNNGTFIDIREIKWDIQRYTGDKMGHLKIYKIYGR